MAPVIIPVMAIWGVISILFGILVLVFPKILNYMVALYLIIVGIMMLLPSLGVAI